ncbi:hypothetical protein [Oceanirhabdus seepicola]|uniref:Uncharacterized protein n=1 Tax=Oceanirhabdus seepicola TaxID=2828781 RepID=A0A9J6NWL8_9CLOT|nr:hypothetical protein [Oceanirhabdus seepicola]MCM1988297.1 hypothetical protein [Oceanirhabdus seepicola]
MKKNIIRVVILIILGIVIVMSIPYIQQVRSYMMLKDSYEKYKNYSSYEYKIKIKYDYTNSKNNRALIENILEKSDINILGAKIKDKHYGTIGFISNNKDFSKLLNMNYKISDSEIKISLGELFEKSIGIRVPSIENNNKIKYKASLNKLDKSILINNEIVERECEDFCFKIHSDSVREYIKGIENQGSIFLNDFLGSKWAENIIDNSMEYPVELHIYLKDNKIKKGECLIYLSKENVIKIEKYIYNENNVKEYNKDITKESVSYKYINKLFKEVIYSIFN